MGFRAGGGGGARFAPAAAAALPAPGLYGGVYGGGGFADPPPIEGGGGGGPFLSADIAEGEWGIEEAEEVVALDAERPSAEPPPAARFVCISLAAG